MCRYIRFIAFVYLVSFNLCMYPSCKDNLSGTITYLQDIDPRIITLINLWPDMNVMSPLVFFYMRLKKAIARIAYSEVVPPNWKAIFPH